MTAYVISDSDRTPLPASYRDQLPSCGNPPDLGGRLPEPTPSSPLW
jgi:hypothetical protein